MPRRKTISDEDLLAVARSVFVEKGFGVATREIARRAGISEGMLFQRFHTKAELFFAPMVLPPLDLSHLFQQSGLTGYALMEKITFAMIDYFRETLPVLLPLAMHSDFRFEDFATRHPNSPLAALRTQITSFFDEQVQSGAIGKVHAGSAALVVWSIANTVVFFEYLGAHGGKFQPDIVMATVRCAWDGLAPPETPPPPTSTSY
ncbi:MAG: TetR/AcrR family transcriptional regulator [Acidobacteria bacterium]|nr:TetR/AcrR family transcriptional regulator [Acidobacteriota bacterium]